MVDEEPCLGRDGNVHQFPSLVGLFPNFVIKNLVLSKAFQIAVTEPCKAREQKYPHSFSLSIGKCLGIVYEQKIQEAQLFDGEETPSGVHAMDFDFLERISLNKAIFVAPLAVVIYWARDIVGRKNCDIIMSILILSLLILYLYRMFCSDGSVVSFEPQNGMIFKVIRMIGGLKNVSFINRDIFKVEETFDTFKEKPAQSSKKKKNNKQ